MSEVPEPNSIAKAKVVPLQRLSGLWLIPIVTLIVAGVMVYNNYRSQGPLITITLANAAGLQEGVTKIKTRDVEIGQVEEITLNSALDGVVVTARIHNDFRFLLKSDSRFWVVQPTVSLAGVSGLNTLITGQYIRFSPGEARSTSNEFTGLDQAPLTPLGSPGLHVTLMTEGDFSLSKGDSIHYQGIDVGKIEDLRFDLAAGRIYYDAFIEAPFHELITSDTRFWKASGLRAALTSEGFEVETGTVDSILLGGISFTTPAGQLTSETLTEKSEFYVYPNRNAIYDRQYKFAVQYWIMVRESISGLSVDGRVMHRGVQVGRVLRTDYIPEGRNLLDRTLDIPVLIEINPGRLGLPDSENSLQLATADINTWIRQGLTATIKSQNFLLGQQMVELEYKADSLATELSYFNELVVIPTGLDSIQKFTYSIEELLTKLNQLPLETMLDNVSELAVDAGSTLENMDALIASANELMANDRNTTMLNQVTDTLAALESLALSFSAESRTSQEMQSTLNAITDLMNEFRPLAVELKNKPNSLVFPTATQPELQPTRKLP